MDFGLKDEEAVPKRDSLFTIQPFGSLGIALKRTRPRQRFWFMLGGISRPRTGCVKDEISTDLTGFIVARVDSGSVDHSPAG
jgi:hypothetical protein